MKPQKIKTDAATFQVPQSHDDAVAAIAEIGRLQRERTRIETAMNDELAGVRQRYEEEAKPYADQILNLTRGVHLWAEANRTQLTLGGKTKTAHLASGELKWRMRPPSVTVRAIENVLDALKKLGLQRFVRVKEEVNKEAVLAEPATVEHIKGITITQKEDFVITPFETALEEVA